MGGLFVLFIVIRPLMIVTRPENVKVKLSLLIFHLEIS